MEGFVIFLLLVIILLVVIFNSARNSKLSRLENKLTLIENYLRSLQLQQIQKPLEQTQAPVAEPVKPIVPPVIPPKTEEPVVPVYDQKHEPVKQPVVQPVIPVQQTQTVQSTVNIQQPLQQQVKQPAPPKTSWYDNFRKNNPDLEKFIGENILSKVAITILVIGVAFFVKYAIDRDWINEIARVGIGVLCGVIVMVFAHRLHKRFKAFSSVLVAGAISIFYFTIGIAFHEYHIFGQTAAFMIMLLITGFSVFISVLYDRVELATLSLIGGFATPFMVSTGEGNYIILFSYILILDLGMLVLAYLRKWNLINILAYCFTTILYVGFLQSRVVGLPNAPYKGVFLFGAVFYTVFIVMNIINNIKEKRRFGVMELSMLISNTFIFYGMGMQILSYYHPELKGAFSGIIAGFNLICSWLLFKKFKADDKLVYLMIGLTLTFITLIAPVQLHGNYITIFWALESVLLIWLAQRSGIVMYRFASVIVTLMMGISLMMDWGHVYLSYSEVPVSLFINKAFITGLISSICVLAVVLLLRKEEETLRYLGIPFNPKTYRVFLSIIFLVLLYFTGMFELVYQLNQTDMKAMAIAVSAGAYHFLFFALVNVAAMTSKAKQAQVTLYVFNFINAGIFVLIFSMLPVMELKSNLLSTDHSSTGFMVHYISLLSVAFITWRMRASVKSAVVSKAVVLNTILVSIAVVYVLSIELVLHGLKFSLQPILTYADAEISLKIKEYAITEKHIFKTGYPVLWGLLAFLFLFIGMKKQNKTLRVMSLVLIAVTLLKLFTFDIRDASEAGKIIAFVILGVVLLIISFMYQKIKALLLDDDKKPEEVPSTNP